jgi:hypothetical protein
LKIKQSIPNEKTLPQAKNEKEKVNGDAPTYVGPSTHKPKLMGLKQC